MTSVLDVEAPVTDRFMVLCAACRLVLKLFTLWTMWLWESKAYGKSKFAVFGELIPPTFFAACPHILCVYSSQQLSPGSLTWTIPQTKVSLPITDSWQLATVAGLDSCSTMIGDYEPATYIFHVPLSEVVLPHFCDSVWPPGTRSSEQGFSVKEPVERALSWWRKPPRMM